jgi:outer membrane protein TolC
MKTVMMGLVLALVLNTTAAQQRLSMDAAVQTALQHNQALRGARYDRDAAKWGRLNAVTNFLPKVQVSGGVARIDPESERRANAAVDFIKVAANQFGIPQEYLADLKPFAYRDTYSTDITVVQPVFNGGLEIVGLTAANAQEDRSIAMLQDTEQDVVAKVRTAYLGVLKAEELTGLARESVARMQRHLDVTKRRADVGMRTSTDVLRWQVELASGEGTLVQAENGLAMSRLALNEVMGVDLQAVFTLDRTAVGDSVQVLPAPDVAVTEAQITADLLQAHPTMRGMEAGLRLADAGVSQAWTSFLPRVNVAFQYGWEKNNTIRLDGIRPWALALQVSYPIFNSFGDYTNLQKAQAEYARTESQVETGRRGLVMQATFARMNVRSALKRVEITRTAEREAREVLDQITRRYEAGGASNVDLIDVQTAYTAARANAITALYDYHIASIGLDRAMGTIGSQN